MAIFISPFVDRGFKILFGQEENKDLLIDLLNSLFEGERYITELSFMNVEMPGETTESRGAVFDLKCKDKDGSVFIIEIQNAPQTYFYERGLYYLCRVVSNQDEKGKGWKFSLYPVYGVFLLNFESGKANKVRTDIVLSDRETGKQVSDAIHQVYLEMPFFDKEEAECKTSLDYWLYTLKHMESLEALPFKGQKQLFEKLERLAKVVNLNKKERAEYEECLKVYRDNENVLDYAIEKGEARGEARGEAKGFARGQRLIASNLKKRGVEPDIIAQSTGLSVEEVEQL